ncbi:MAG: 4'-phosphopantetheinyl transferase superfamily protein [Myxococcales bacterium]
MLAPFRGRLPLTISLSHREDLALVALTDRPEAPLGADLEKCEPRSEGFVGDFFTEKEATESFASADLERCVTEIWSLKEAALKALRLGLTVDTRRVEASPRREPCACWRPAAVELSLQFVRSHGQALVRDFGGYVATLVWLGPGPMEVPCADYRGGPVLDEPSPAYPLGQEVVV